MSPPRRNRSRVQRPPLARCRRPRPRRILRRSRHAYARGELEHQWSGCGGFPYAASNAAWLWRRNLDVPSELLAISRAEDYSPPPLQRPGDVGDTACQTPTRGVCMAYRLCTAHRTGAWGQSGKADRPQQQPDSRPQQQPLTRDSSSRSPRGSVCVAIDVERIVVEDFETQTRLWIYRSKRSTLWDTCSRTGAASS